MPGCPMAGARPGNAKAPQCGAFEGNRMAEAVSANVKITNFQRDPLEPLLQAAFSTKPLQRAPLSSFKIRRQSVHQGVHSEVCTRGSSKWEN